MSGEQIKRMMIEDFGEPLSSVWQALRPATRSLVERALTNTTTAARKTSHGRVRPPASVPYDARAEAELRRLLAALDNRLRARDEASLDLTQQNHLRRLIETCAAVLLAQAQAAESFAQLLERAFAARDYARVDAIADALTALPPISEVCELARHTDKAVRAVALEALALTSTSKLAELLGDPVDAPLVRHALLTQAFEYGNNEARWIIEAVDEMEAFEDIDGMMMD